MLAAIDDPCCVTPIIELIEQYQQNSLPAELHIYAQGSHGFNLGQRSELRSISTWTDSSGRGSIKQSELRSESVFPFYLEINCDVFSGAVVNNKWEFGQFSSKEPA